MARWELAELRQSRERGAWDRWGVQDLTGQGEWLRFEFRNRRIYAPLEHPELPHQFVAAANREDSLVRFVGQYGRLGWHELVGSDLDWRRTDPWFKRMLTFYRQALQASARDGQSDAVYAEPVEWIRAHARTVEWCLAAGLALRRAGRIREQACLDLRQRLPKPYGCRASVRPELFRERVNEVSPVTFVGGMLGDYLSINLKGVRRRVVFTSETGMRSVLGGDSLLESIYTLVADAVTDGRLAPCEACGKVFIQTDERQRFCPPREGQVKSTCMNRVRVQRFRQKERRQRGTSTRTR